MTLRGDSMTREEIINHLLSNANPSRLKRLKKLGYDGEAIGVNLGPIRQLAKKIGINHALGVSLWDTRILEGQLLACMIMDPKEITSLQAQAMISEIHFTETLDDLMYRCLVEIDELEDLEVALNKVGSGMAGRAYWCIQVHKVHEKLMPDFLIRELLDRASKQLPQSDEQTQWMMNRFVAEVGIHEPSYREQCLNIGESCGVYRDMKVSKGCTSAYIPSWIHAVIKEVPWK